MSAKLKFTKSQIKTMGSDQCSNELRAPNLDSSDRLREVLYPNVNVSSQSQN